jgi:hypothetical protein
MKGVSGTASHSTRRVGKSQNNAIACRRETHPRPPWGIPKEPRDFMRPVSLIVGIVTTSVNHPQTTHPRGQPSTMNLPEANQTPGLAGVTDMQIAQSLGVVDG